MTRAVFASTVAKPGRAADELFDISSITKTFTATLIADLAVSGAVDLDDPIGRYLPRDQQGPTDATLRSLACHTAGLPPGGPLESMDEVLPEFATAPRSRAGQYRYSNLGYTLLGHVVSVASSMPLPDFARERILVPLGMTATAFAGELGDRPLAQGTHADTGEPLALRTWVPLPGAGNIWATPGDLLRWASAWLDPPEHLADAMDLALRPQHVLGAFDGVPETWNLPALPGRRRAIGLCWRIEHDGLVWHTGGTPGFATFCAFNRRDGSATVTLLARGIGHLPTSIRSIPTIARFLRIRAKVRATARAGRLATPRGSPRSS